MSEFNDNDIIYPRFWTRMKYRYIKPIRETLDWWNFKPLRVAWVRFKLLLSLRLTDCENIQYAIDKGTNHVFLRAGIYNINRPIIMRSFARIEGEI